MKLLNDLYQGGADYVDIHGERDFKDDQDKVTFSTLLEYMTPEAQESLKNEPEPPEQEYEKEELSKEDIKDIISHV